MTTSKASSRIGTTSRTARVLALLVFGALGVAGAVGCSAEVDEDGEVVDDSVDGADDSQIGETSDDVRGYGHRPRREVRAGEGRARPELLPKPRRARAGAARERLHEPMHRDGGVRATDRGLHLVASHALPCRGSRRRRRTGEPVCAARVRAREDEPPPREPLRPRELRAAALATGRPCERRGGAATS